jgi:hypothetical protein
MTNLRQENALHSNSLSEAIRFHLDQKEFMLEWDVSMIREMDEFQRLSSV